MRKKVFIILTMIVLAIMSCCLVACVDKTNFDGKADITINLDKEYEDVTVSCPEGSIEQKSSKQWTVSLKSTKPVDVIVTCPGFESVIISYTTEKLKTGSITENISFKDALYRFSFRVSVNDEETYLKLAEDYKDIRLTIQSGMYVLESSRPINQDIVLNFSDDYKPIVLYKEAFKYNGINGKLAEELPLLEKNSENAVIFMPVVENDVNEFYFTDVHNPTDIYESVQVTAGKYKQIEISDYKLSYYSQTEFCELIKAESLQDGYVRLESSLVNGWYNYILNYNRDNYSFYNTKIDCIYWQLSDMYGRNQILKTNRQLVAGDILTYVYYDYYNNNQSNNKKIHIVTEEEAESKTINIDDCKDISNFAGRQFQIEIVDNDGNVLDYKFLNFQYTSIGENTGNNKDYVFTYDSYYDNYESLTLEVQMGDIFKRFDITNEIAYAFSNSNDAVVKVQVNFYKNTISDNRYDYNTTNVTFRYFDVAKKEFITYSKVVELKDGDTISMYNADIADTRYSNYSVIDFKNLIYFESLFGNQITINVVKNYEIRLNITNYQILNNIDYDYGQFMFGNSLELSISISQIRVGNGMVTIRVPEIYLGQSLQFTYSHYPKYTMVIEFPDESNIHNTIDVTIEEPDNDW